MIYKIHDFWKIVCNFEEEFIDSLHRHSITTVKRDFSNLFFVYFVRNLCFLLGDDKDSKVLYVEKMRINELTDHFYEEELVAFFDIFYKKISRLFPSIFFKHETVLDGCYTSDEVDCSVVEKIVRLRNSSKQYLKLEKELKKRVNRLKETIRMQNFHEL